MIVSLGVLFISFTCLCFCLPLGVLAWPSFVRSLSLVASSIRFAFLLAFGCLLVGDYLVPLFDAALCGATSWFCVLLYLRLRPCVRMCVSICISVS